MDHSWHSLNINPLDLSVPQLKEKIEVVIPVIWVKPGT